LENKPILMLNIFYFSIYLKSRKINIFLNLNVKIMLGSIIACMEHLVKNEFGLTKWENILIKSGLPKNHVFFAHKVTEDEIFEKLFQNSCKELNLSSTQLSEVFGEAWMKYAKEKYFAFFSSKSTAKEFILDMDRTHTKVTDRIENATPPKFIYQEIDTNSFYMTYSSKRNLPHIWIGLLKAVGSHFGEKVEIVEITKNKVKITFEK